MNKLFLYQMNQINQMNQITSNNSYIKLWCEYYVDIVKSSIINGYLYILGLFTKPNNIDKLQNSLNLYCRYGDLEKVKELVAKGVNVKARDNCALRWAAEYGNLEVVKFLIENKAEVTGSGSYALIMACENGYLEVVKYLVECGTNIKILNDRAIKRAHERGHNDIVEYLIKFYDVNPLELA
ncbi:ankyrin repeat protein [Cotonvirus japonicus]|uniref:Ankyrin repeat protein n=1 Tax=Cotonvirus japonicus TaxID=2811091 RepID=A0ABM7NR39_9VIRU|nr:ankyrin repeat protein [Cotonvirus japonicus]BCS82625.1 ankyrin repeat protein [Cotonvirus japonicus]